MSTSSKIGLGILAGLVVYLIYRMFEGYQKQVPASPLATTSSNLQDNGGSGGLLRGPTIQKPTVPPATGPAVEARKGAGHF